MIIALIFLGIMRKGKITVMHKIKTKCSMMSQIKNLIVKICHYMPAHG